MTAMLMKSKDWRCTWNAHLLVIDKAKSDHFVHSLQLTPNIRFVLANNSQIRDIKDFCCGICDFSILGIDTTYNISKKFYFTPMTY